MGEAEGGFGACHQDAQGCHPLGEGRRKERRGLNIPGVAFCFVDTHSTHMTRRRLRFRDVAASRSTQDVGCKVKPGESKSPFPEKTRWLRICMPSGVGAQFSLDELCVAVCVVVVWMMGRHGVSSPYAM